MSFLKKIQEKPEPIRKIIFWIIVIFLGIVFLIIWIYSVKTRLEATRGQRIFEQLRPPKFEEKLEFPKIEIPKLSEEELKKLEEELKRAEEQK